MFKSIFSKRTLATVSPITPPFRIFDHKKKIAAFASVTALTIYGWSSLILLIAALSPAAPRVQLKHDPSKKDLVILGTGWASTSLLQEISSEYNVTLISPRNYFLFTPLLPSCTVGTLEMASIMEPIRHFTRIKERECVVVEGSCTKISPNTKSVTISDKSGQSIDIKYDALIVACGAENQTFGIKGVHEHANFLKEISDAQIIRQKIISSFERASFPGVSEAEITRLLHMVVVGGGPTGVEYAGELHDYLTEDLHRFYPLLVDKVKITLIEALPHVLPMFSSQLVKYTEDVFEQNGVEIMSQTKVLGVAKESITISGANGVQEVPYGTLVWATGNCARPVVTDLMKQLPATQTMRRGLVVDDCLQVAGCEGIYALGDASATSFPATAQVASKQGEYLARRLNAIGEIEKDLNKLEKMEISTFEAVKALPPFSHASKGMLAYIGSDKAIADFPIGVKVGGIVTNLLWRSAYFSGLFSVRNKFMVASDWIKVVVFGRDIGRD